MLMSNALINYFVKCFYYPCNTFSISLLSMFISSPRMTSLYPGHIPLSLGSRILLGVGSAAMAISDPRRGDMVAAMGEATAFESVLERIR